MSASTEKMLSNSQVSYSPNNEKIVIYVACDWDFNDASEFEDILYNQLSGLDYNLGTSIEIYRDFFRNDNVVQRTQEVIIPLLQLSSLQAVTHFLRVRM